MRSVPAVLTALTALAALSLLTACGSPGLDPRAAGLTPTASPSTGSVVDLADEVVGRGMLMQTSPTADVELCVGAVLTSWPPQCSGPAVVGDVDWDALAPQRSRGRTWTDGSVWAVGRLDPSAGPTGRLTLTRPLSLTPPAGLAPSPDPTGAQFPQLCDDPYAGGGRPGGGSPEAQNALSQRLETLDGYIGSWVSDGSSMFNVLVTGDAAAARETLRVGWKGGLCVEQRDLPTQTEVRSAQQALSTVPGLLSSSGNAVDGTLDIQVVVLDAATRQAILAALGPRFDTERVRVTSTFTALP